MSRKLRLIAKPFVKNVGTLHRGGPLVPCLFCDDQLFNNDMGIRAHVAKHARNKECDPARQLEYRLQTSGEKMKHHTEEK